MVLVLIIALVIEGIAFAFYLGWRSVIRGWKSEIGKAQGSTLGSESLASLDREIGVMEIVLNSLRLFKRNFRFYVVPFAASGLAIGLLNLVLQMVIPVQPPRYTSPVAGFIESPVLLFQSIVLTVLTSPVSALVDGMGVSITVNSLGHENTGLRRGYADAKNKFKQLWSVAILTGIVTDLASSVPIIELIPEITFFVVFPVVIIEGKPTLNVLKRSWQLVNNRWTAVFELLIVAGLITFGPSLVILYATAFESQTEILATEFYGGLVAPIVICVSVVYYYSSVARLSAPPTTAPIPQSQPGPKRWACRNCGTSVIMASRPSVNAFGGCLKAKRSWLEYTGKHDWEAMQIDAGT